MRKFTPAELVEAQRLINSKNGQCGTGACKRRGPREHYARMGRKSAALAALRKQNQKKP